MRVLFTDGTLDSIQAIYLLFGAGDESMRPQAIIVDEGILDMELAVLNVMSLVAMMLIMVPIYYGSQRLVLKTWDDNFKWFPGADRIFERRRLYMYKLRLGTPDIVTEPVEAIALGPLTSVAEWILAGKISHLTFLAGGNITNDQDQATIGKYLNMEPNEYMDPQAYEYVVNSGVPQTLYSLDNISNEEMLKARMLAMGNNFLRSTIPPNLLSEFRFWSLIVMMHYLGYFGGL